MTISDKLSWIGGMLGLFTGFSVISGVEILYWLFFIILCKKKNNVEVDPEKTDLGLCEDCKAKECNSLKELEQEMKRQDEKFMKQEEEMKKQEDKFLKQEEDMKKQNEKVDDLEKKFEMFQMFQKHSEFGDSNAGSFFDALFKTSVVEKKEENTQESV